MASELRLSSPQGCARVEAAPGESMANTCLNTNIKIMSAPQFRNGAVWFVGENYAVYRMPLADPAAAVKIPDVVAYSDLSVSQDGNVYFRGEGNEVTMVQQDPPFLHGRLLPGRLYCLDAPVSPGDGFLYVRSHTNALVRVSLTKATDDAALAKGKFDKYPCLEAPVPVPAFDRIYFVTTPDEGDKQKARLRMIEPINADATKTTPSPYKTLSMCNIDDPIYAGTDGWLYCNNTGRPARFHASSGQILSAGVARTDYAKGSIKPLPYSTAGIAYYMCTDGRLMKVDIPNSKATALGYSTASTPDPQRGFVLYRSLTNLLYKLDI
jgi:hypothetical protein